jgi:hypothetical protein
MMLIIGGLGGIRDAMLMTGLVITPFDNQDPSVSVYPILSLLLSNKYLLKSMFEDSFFSHSPSYLHFPWNALDNAGGDNDGATENERPWECPVCQQSFKWDTQLLRH